MKEQFTPGPWALCYHLESEIQDKKCGCGYNGGMWGPDGEHVICEMGSAKDPNGDSLPRYARSVELANANLIAAAPDMYEALKDMQSMLATYLSTFEGIISTDWEETIQDRLDNVNAALNKANPIK